MNIDAKEIRDGIGRPENRLAVFEFWQEYFFDSLKSFFLFIEELHKCL